MPTRYCPVLDPLSIIFDLLSIIHDLLFSSLPPSQSLIHYPWSIIHHPLFLIKHWAPTSPRTLILMPSPWLPRLLKRTSFIFESLPYPLSIILDPVFCSLLLLPPDFNIDAQSFLSLWCQNNFAPIFSLSQNLFRSSVPFFFLFHKTSLEAKRIQNIASKTYLNIKSISNLYENTGIGMKNCSFNWMWN